MKQSLLVFIGLLMSMLVTAGPVSQNEALQKARQFTNTRGLPAPAMQLAKRQAMSQAQDRAAYYVFNFGHDRGYVIVSGDDRTPAIIGYSNRGSFDEQRMPVNMREWMSEYDRQMEWLGQQPETIVAAKAPVRQTIAPLLSTLWNQGDPYNSLCPYDGSDRSVTGCVATAMAQVVNYHGQHTGLPLGVTTDIPGYTTETEKIYVSSFPSTYQFQWANMLDDYSVSYTSSQQEAVAKLMLACGTAVEMDYSSDESGAQTSAVAGALKQYFGYDAGTSYKQRSTYSISEWNTMIYSELTEGRPVVYNGRSSGGGHAFVIDGFDGDELFHVNWGWGGYQNGYFLLSVLTPSDNSGIGASNTSDGYNFDQGAVFGAQPDAGGEAVPLTMTFSNYEVDGTTLAFEVRNHSGETAQFDFGVAKLNPADHTFSVIFNTYSSNALPPGWGWTRYTVDQSRYANKLSEGENIIGPVSRVRGSSTWILQDDAWVNNFIVVKNGSSFTASTSKLVKLVAKDFDFTGSLNANDEQQMKLKVENQGDEYYGVLYLFANTGSEKPEKYTTRTGITVLEGTTADATFTFTPETAGTYNIWITTDAAGTNVIGQTQVEVTGATSGTYSDTMDIIIETFAQNTNASGNAILGKDIIMVTRITNNSDINYKGYVQFTLYSYNPWTREAYDSRQRVCPANQTTEFVTVFKDIDPTKTYTLGVAYYKNGTWASNWVWGPDYTVAPSVITTLADGTSGVVEASTSFTVPEGVVAVDMRGNTKTTTIVPNSNPNCLYLLTAGATTPTGISGNVVKGDVAQIITLADGGLGFYSPIDFTAQNITYTRTFDKGLEPNDNLFGNNWTTITLPFDVEEVTVGSTAVDFMRNAEDTGKNFWLMAYTEDEEGIVAFDHADAFKGYKPYLIAVPDERAQGHTSMVGSPVVFKGTNAAIEANRSTGTSAEYYKTVGTLLPTPVADRMFVLDGDGKALTAATTAVAPFRAYVTTTAANSDTTVPDLLIMGNVDVTFSGFAKGDVNGDGGVGIADIVAITNVMAGTETDAGKTQRADVNGDGDVGIADIVAVTNIMAGN